MVTDTRIQKSLTQQNCNGCNGCTDSIYPPHTRDGTKHSTRICAISPYKCWKPILLPLRRYIGDFVIFFTIQSVTKIRTSTSPPTHNQLERQMYRCTDVTDHFASPRQPLTQKRQRPRTGRATNPVSTRGLHRNDHDLPSCPSNPGIQPLCPPQPLPAPLIDQQHAIPLASLCLVHGQRIPKRKRHPPPRSTLRLERLILPPWPQEISRDLDLITIIEPNSDTLVTFP